MIIDRFNHGRGRRRAFTLVEVMLTLCLLVIIAALAWPVLTKPFANQRLRKAADRVRARWCEARVDAMGSGQIYVFRYVAGENRFRIESRQRELTADDPALTEDSAGLTGPSGYAAEPRSTEDALPDGVFFVVGETAMDVRAAAAQSDAEPQTALDAEWSEPILFYPDGTTSTAQLQLSNEHGRCIELSLRGLTGVVNVGQVYTGQEQWR